MIKLGKMILIAAIIVMVMPWPVMFSEAIEFNSKVTLIGLQVPPGRYLVKVEWGGRVVEKTVESAGAPVNVDIVVNATNIRKPIVVEIVDESGQSIFNSELIPSVSGYRLMKVVTEPDVVVMSIEISEILSMVSIKMLLKELNVDQINNGSAVQLYVGGESVVPLVYRRGEDLEIMVPPVVIEPGLELTIELFMEGVTFKGSIVLIGDSLIAGGFCEGKVREVSMEVSHIFGQASFKIAMPALQQVMEKEIARSNTYVVIRRGLPEGFRSRIIVMVKDRDGQPIEGATINYFTSDGSSGSVLTNNDGVGVIEVNSTTVMMEVSKPGYKKIERKIEITSTFHTVDVVLDKEKTLLDSVHDGLRVLKQWNIVMIVVGLMLLVSGLLKLRLYMMGIGLLMLALGAMVHFMG